MLDPINPDHYRNQYGVQIIDVIRHLPFSIGNAIKYTYRNEKKENAAQDIKKALWYLEDYIMYPEPAFGIKNITPELVEKVLEGSKPFEEDSFKILLKVAESSIDQNQKEWFRIHSMDSKRLLENRLENLV